MQVPRAKASIHDFALKTCFVMHVYFSLTLYMFRTILLWLVENCPVVWRLK